MKINNIVKLNLETLAKQLRFDGRTYEDISKILSEESGQNITKASVFRYFQTNAKVTAQVIEKSDKLKAQVIETDISTINKRVAIIDKFLDIAEQAQAEGEYKTAILALRGSNEAMNSLDARLGELKPAANNINILNVKEAVTSARELLTSRISGISSRAGEGGVFEQLNG